MSMPRWFDATPSSTQEAINRFAKEFKKLSQTAPKGEFPTKPPEKETLLGLWAKKDLKPHTA